MSRQVVYRVWRLTCPGDAREIGRVRRWIRDVLSGYPCVEEAELIASELSTNAITHSRSGGENGLFTVMLAWSPGVVVMAVTDGGGTVGIPEARQADGEATSGRGLALVQTLADRVDVVSAVTGRTVKAVLHYEEKDAAHQLEPMP